MDVSEETNQQPYGVGVDGFVVVTAPEYDQTRTRALQNKPYRRTAVHKMHLEARATDCGLRVVYGWRVLHEQARRRGNYVSTNSV